MSHGPIEILLIGYGNRLTPKYAVVLYDDDSGLYRLNRLPNPIFVSVDVNRKEAEVFRKAGPTKEQLDIFPRNPRAFRLKVILPIDFIALHIFDVLRRTIKNHSLPIVIQ